MEIQIKPIAWMVIRDSECDPPEYFSTAKEAYHNACLGLVNTSVIPLYSQNDIQRELNTLAHLAGAVKGLLKRAEDAEAKLKTVLGSESS